MVKGAVLLVTPLSLVVGVVIQLHGRVERGGVCDVPVVLVPVLRLVFHVVLFLDGVGCSHQ